MPTATMTTKGQVTIPKEIREHLKIDTGDRLSFVLQEDGSVVVKPITRDVRELGGLLRRPEQRSVSLREMDEGIARRMRSKFGRRR
jgi:AbrB family looped-hinge helix DNA binding protein